MGRFRGVRIFIIAVAAVGAASALAPAATASPIDTHGYLALVGTLHGHSGYSDGYPGSIPATYYASAKAYGNDFMSGSEHSDNADLPIVANDECLTGVVILSCLLADPVKPLNSFRKWAATAEYARAATTSTFTALRGFEWTSDRFGHINVYFSTHDANAKIDGGYALMNSFYSWFTRPVALGGGADGLATFNHPGDKSLADGDPGFNWNDFAYNAKAADRMVGIELYNTASEYGTSHGGTDPAEGYYAHALDKGWYLGAIGAEDLGHHRGDNWGGPQWAKTVVLASDRSAGAMKAAMYARRFYAIRRPGIQLDFTVDGFLMGTRLTRAAGAPLAVSAATNLAGATLELVTSGGASIATGSGGVLSASPPAAVAQHYYFVRVRDASGEPVAYSSPIWVTAQ
jgi:hypothetical protein